MNRSKCEYMTGLRSGNLKLDNGKRNYFLYDGTLEIKDGDVVTAVYQVNSLSAADAYQQLHDMHWQDVRKSVIKKANFRCAQCNFPGGLDVHHIVERSKGANNYDETNLTAICRKCHSGYHGIKAKTR